MRIFWKGKFWSPAGSFLLLAVVLLVSISCQGSPVKSQPSPTAVDRTPTPLATLPPVYTPSPVSTPTAEPVPDLGFQPADLKGLQIRFWHPLTGGGADQLQALVRQFNQSNEWGIQVSLMALGGAGPLASAVDQAKAEDLPEVVMAPSEQLAEWQQPHSLLADLNQYLVLETWGMPKAERDGYLELFWKQDQFTGKGASGSGSEQLGIPALRTATGLVYNRSFASELGFKNAPQTPQELLDQACAAAKRNNGFLDLYGTGGWMVDTTAISAMSWMAVFGADATPTSPDGDWHFDQPKAVDALRYLRGMQEKGCLWEPKHPTPYEYFGDRMALFFTASFQDLALTAGYIKKIASKDELVFIPFPGLDGKPVLFSYGYSYGVVRGQSPAKQMAAWLFVRWMSQPDNQARLATAWLSFPVSEAEKTGLSGKASDFPWNSILPLLDAARPAPALATWPLVRRPLEDAFWQLFNLASADQIPQLLPQLDQMAAELIRNRP